MIVNCYSEIRGDTRIFGAGAAIHGFGMRSPRILSGSTARGVLRGDADRPSLLVSRKGYCACGRRIRVNWLTFNDANHV
jgi:hypothetical protein